MAIGMNVVGYGICSVSTTACDLKNDFSVSLPSKAKRAYFTVETGAVRWRADGTAPTVDEGHLVAAADSFSFMTGNYRSLLEKIDFCCDVSTTASEVKVTYFD